MVMVRAWARFGRSYVLGGTPAPPGSRRCWLATAGRDNREGPVRYSRKRAPGRRPGRNPADGPVTSVLDPQPRREPPRIKTMSGAALFPRVLGTPDQPPDPREHDQRPPRKPGAAADDGHDRPDSDEGRSDHGPGSHRYRTR